MRRVVRHKSTLLTVLWLLMTLPRPIWADVMWMPISDQDLIKGSDLIVVGKIVHIDRNTQDGVTDSGQIQVARTLAGQVPAGGVVVDFPSARDTQQVDGKTIPVYGPLDVAFSNQQEGIWFLRRGQNGHYIANHPARFKPLVYLAKIQKEVTQVIASSGQ